MRYLKQHLNEDISLTVSRIIDNSCRSFCPEKFQQKLVLSSAKVQVENYANSTVIAEIQLTTNLYKYT